MIQSHKLSFYILIGLIFLTPLFFIPGTLLALPVAKSTLFIVGIVAALLCFVYESWQEGRLSLPRHYFMAVVAALPAVYLLSSLLATPSSLSLFGYSLEVGTFGFMLLGAVLLVLVSVVFSDTARVLQALAAFLFSFSLLAIFVAIKILTDSDTLAWGNFSGKMGNPLGSWTDLGITFGFLAVFVSLILGMVPMRGLVKGALYAVFALSTAFLVIVGFSTAFAFVLAAAIGLFFYFRKVEPAPEGMHPNLLPIILGVVALVFLVNPNIGTDRKLGGVVSNTFGVDNTEVRPSLSATLGISKAVLTQSGLLGSGPNTFGHDWLIYKPAEINATPFWGVSFPFGAGFLTTQIATTGILGSAVWLAFLILLVVLATKGLSHLPESRAERVSLVSTLIATLFLWGASFFYVPSGPVLILAFAFTGLFIATLVQMGVVPVYTFDIKRSSVAAVAALLIVLAAAGIGWTGLSRTVAAYHFNRAVALSNVAGMPLSEVENHLVEAVNTAPADVYFVSLSRLNFSRAQMALNQSEGTDEENQAIFEESLRRAIDAARRAVAANPAGFENWTALGNIYAALVPAPFSVEGAYENALFAYNEAVKRNPNNPEIALLLARLEINKENVEAARSYIRSAIALKEDYADAYLLLAQIEVAAGNTAAAIASAEALAVLLPNNPGIHFELGLLKYSARDYEGSADSLRQALALSPEYGNAKYYLGLVLANLGRFTEAEAELEALLEANPDNADLKRALDAVKVNKVPVQPTANSQSTNN